MQKQNKTSRSEVNVSAAAAAAGSRHDLEKHLFDVFHCLNAVVVIVIVATAAALLLLFICGLLSFGA